MSTVNTPGRIDHNPGRESLGKRILDYLLNNYEAMLKVLVVGGGSSVLGAGIVNAVSTPPPPSSISASEFASQKQDNLHKSIRSLLTELDDPDSTNEQRLMCIYQLIAVENNNHGILDANDFILDRSELEELEREVLANCESPLGIRVSVVTQNALREPENVTSLLQRHPELLVEARDQLQSGKGTEEFREQLHEFVEWAEKEK